MLQKFTPLRRKTQQVFSQTSNWTQRHFIRVIGLLLLVSVLWYKDLNFSLNLNQSTFSADPRPALPSLDYEATGAEAVATSLRAGMQTSAFFEEKKQSPAPKTEPTPAALQVTDDNLGNTYSNMTYTFDAKSVKQHSEKDWTTKRKKQEKYISRFADVAQAEMERYGIPASITLAQGLIETNAGESRLAIQNNNHFGMKCFSKKCGKGHCSNFTDDSHKDFFRKYKSAWDSYRAHSNLLMGKRYRHLKKLGDKDYRGWARGLKKAGYATDRRYAEKLINLIEELKLYRFDLG